MHVVMVCDLALSQAEIPVKHPRSVSFGFSQFANPTVYESLDCRISHIVSVGPQEEVLRIYARFIVAPVKHVEPWIKGSVSFGISHTMSTQYPITNLDLAIAIPIE